MEKVIEKDNIFSVYMNPTVELPGYFPEVEKYTNMLGDEPLNVIDTADTRTVIFPGGKVEYNNSDKNFDLGFIPARQITIYGIAVEPGRRAIGTEGFDTNILFYIVPVNDGEPVYRKDEKLKQHILLINPQLAMIMAIKEPTQDSTNIRNWWNK